MPAEASDPSGASIEATPGNRDNAGSGQCSSPPCMLDAEGALPPDAPQAVPGPEDWADTRRWRKAKRTVLIERRVAMASEDRAACTERITGALMGVLAQALAGRGPVDAAAPATGGRLVGFYWPFKGEYDPRPLVRTLHAQGLPLALPVVVGKAQPLVFRPWHPGAAMALGVWNIPVPAEGDPVLPDALLVPLVGFDRRGYRLGYGGGFYDRTVAAMPARPLLVGIGFELSRLPTIHPQPHDIRMDLVVTERGVEEFGRTS